MRRYYIIGAKRKTEEGWEDRWEQMLEAKAVDVGYAWNRNLAGLYGKSEDEIFDTLKKKGESEVSCHAHKLFLTVRPGDIVAVKNFAAPKGKAPRLAIHGYAVVRMRNGRVYQHTKSHLPHQISVDFLECGKEHLFHIGGYAGTIHRLSNPAHIRRIFSPIFASFSSADKAELEDSKRGKRRDTALKNVEELAYRINKMITATAKHNKLQNHLYQQLVTKHGVENVLMERNHVDLQVRVGKELTLYEVKPFHSPLLCLREALGQIMLYSWRLDSEREVKLKLVIAGPSKMTKDDQEFLGYLRQRFGEGLSYLAIG
jgi:hypothetical protein